MPSVAGAAAALPAVPFLYHFLSLLRPASATPGQALMGLTVRRDPDLGPPTGLQALIFTAVSAGAFLVPVAASAGAMVAVARAAPKPATTCRRLILFSSFIVIVL